MKRCRESKAFQKWAVFLPQICRCGLTFWPHWASSCHPCHMAAISTPADQALAPCRRSVRGFLLSQMVSPVFVSLHTGILVASVSGQEMMGEDMTWQILSAYPRIIHSIGVPRTNIPNIPIITQHTSNIWKFFSIKAKIYCDRWSVIHTTQHLRKEWVD